MVQHPAVRPQGIRVPGAPATEQRRRVGLAAFSLTLAAAAIAQVTGILRALASLFKQVPREVLVGRIDLVARSVLENETWVLGRSARPARTRNAITESCPPS